MSGRTMGGGRLVGGDQWNGFTSWFWSGECDCKAVLIFFEEARV